MPTTFAAAQATRHHAPGIAACYLFDENTIGVVDNALDTADKGTLGALGSDTSEPVRVAGVDGGALRFDGANDYVEIAASPALDIAGSFTIEAWIRRTTIGSPDVIVAKEGGAGRNYRLRVTTGDVLELSWETASGSSRTTLGTQRFVDAAWHHVAAVHDQSRAEDRLYVDGALDVRKSQSGTPAACVDPLLIGAKRTTSIKEPFAGEIDLVRIATVVLYDAAFVPPVTFDLGPPEYYSVLTWGAPATGGTATGYAIERSVNAEDYVSMTPEWIPALQWIDPQPVDGVLRYVVRAINDIGTSANSQPVEIVFGSGAQPPQLLGEPSLRVQRHRQPTAGDAIWNFDDGAGSTTADATSKGHALVLGSSSTGDAAEPVWIEGVAGHALRFDGVNDYGRADDALDLRYGGSFTVEAWVRPAQLGTYSVLLSKESSSSGRNYRLALTLTGKVELSWKNTLDATQTLSSDATLVAGTWHHVAGVFDAALGENRVYIDGRLRGRKPAALVPQPTDVAVRVGARLASSSLRDYFAGDLDLVRVTGAALYTGDFSAAPLYGPRLQTTHLLAWNPAQPGSARLVGYRVERRIDAGAWSPVVPSPLEATTLVVADAGGTRTCYRITAVDRLDLASDAIEQCTGGERPPSGAPLVAKAMPAAPFLAVGPNPFNPSTTVRLHLDAAAAVDVRIYDVRGRCVRNLVRGSMPAGEHRWVWDGRDAQSTTCATGVYFIHVRAGERTERVKVVLAK